MERAAGPQLLQIKMLLSGDRVRNESLVQGCPRVTGFYTLDISHFPQGPTTDDEHLASHPGNMMSDP